MEERLKEEQVRDFLEQSRMPKIDQERAHELERPITLGEFREAISCLKANKAPGPDGYTGAYFKMFSDQLEEPFLRAFIETPETGILSPEILKAKIVLIPKEGKDALNCSSFRPISLLNQDIKIYSKILANRMLPLIPELIHADQMGFVPTREARDNVVRVLDLASRVIACRRPSLLLTTDAEKAFDRINWKYMEAVLEYVGLGTKMRKMILALRQYVLMESFQNNLILIMAPSRVALFLHLCLYSLWNPFYVKLGSARM